MTFIKINTFGETNVGLVRKNNEDYLTYFEPGSPDVIDEFGRLYIVADGVGGAATGEVASKYAALKVLHTYYSQYSMKPWQRIKVGMKHANEALVAYIRQNAQARMATTMTAAAVNGTEMTVVNVGDSRAYLLRNGEIRQLTQDHNLVNEMIRNGVLTEEQAKTAKVKNQLTSSLGGHEVFKADVFVQNLEPGDRVLLCSDGFCRYAEDIEIVKKFMQTGTPQQIVTNCIQYARNSGGQDNITVMSLEIGELLPQPSESYDRGTQPVPVDLREVVSNPLTLDARSPSQEADRVNEEAEGSTQMVALFQPDRSAPQIPVREAYAVPGINMAADDADLMDTDNLSDDTSEATESLVLLNEETGDTSVTSDELRTVSGMQQPAPSQPISRPVSVQEKANTRALSMMVAFSAVIVLILVILAVIFGLRFLRARQAENQASVPTPVIVANTEVEAKPTTPPEPTATELPTDAPTLEPTAEPQEEQAPFNLADSLGECLFEVQEGQTISTILENIFSLTYDDTAEYEVRNCETGTEPLVCQDPVVIADHNDIKLGDYLVIPDVERSNCEELSGIWYTGSQP